MSLSNITIKRNSLAVAAIIGLAGILGGAGCVHQPQRADRPFTLVMLPDTQFYSKMRPHLFYGQIDWIKANQKKENIVFVTQVGDIVHDHSKIMSQWTVASNAMAGLNGVVPWGVTIGNHDYDSGGIKQGLATVWLQHFGPDRFAGRPWYGGASTNGLNSYQLFSGGGVDFVILQLEVNVPDDAIVWAETVLKQYPKRAAIVSTHTYLKGKEGVTRNPRHDFRPTGNSGVAVWEKLIRRNPQIFMVLCAHEGGTDEYYQVSPNDAGNQVVEMLADFQKRTNGGDGWLRLIRFVPAKRQMEMRTYSPALGKFETDANSQFTVPWEMPAASWGPEVK